MDCASVGPGHAGALLGDGEGTVGGMFGLLFFQDCLTLDLLGPLKTLGVSSDMVGLLGVLNDGSGPFLSGVTVLASEWRVERFSWGTESRSDSSSCISFFSSNLKPSLLPFIGVDGFTGFVEASRFLHISTTLDRLGYDFSSVASCSSGLTASALMTMEVVLLLAAENGIFDSSRSSNLFIACSRS